MTIANVVNQIAMAILAVTTCGHRCRMVGNHCMTCYAISHYREVLIMAVQTCINCIWVSVIVRIGKGDQRTGWNGLAVLQMVTVGNSAGVTKTTIRFYQVLNLVPVHGKKPYISVLNLNLTLNLNPRPRIDQGASGFSCNSPSTSMEHSDCRSFMQQPGRLAA